MEARRCHPPLTPSPTHQPDVLWVSPKAKSLRTDQKLWHQNRHGRNRAYGHLTWCKVTEASPPESGNIDSRILLPNFRYCGYLCDQSWVLSLQLLSNGNVRGTELILSEPVLPFGSVRSTSALLTLCGITPTCSAEVTIKKFSCSNQK